MRRHGWLARRGLEGCVCVSVECRRCEDLPYERGRRRYSTYDLTLLPSLCVFVFVLVFYPEAPKFTTTTTTRNKSNHPIAPTNHNHNHNNPVNTHKHATRSEVEPGRKRKTTERNPNAVGLIASVK